MCQNSDAQAQLPGTSAWFRSLLAGPVAGLCSRLLVYPADTIKARLQVQGALPAAVLYKSTLDAAQRIAQQEGLRGFYKGFLAVAVGSIPGNIAFFGGFELGKELIPGGHGMVSDIAVGAVAQLAGGLVFTPMDIVKERMQVQSVMQGAYSYSSSLQALQALVSRNGVTGLFKGYWATNAVWLPWSALYIAMYEQAKRTARTALATQHHADSRDASMCPAGSLDTVSSHELHSAKTTTMLASGRSSDQGIDTSQAGGMYDPASGHASGHASGETAMTVDGESSASSAVVDDLPPWVLAGCSAGSATVAAIVTHPADVVKTRLQVLSASSNGGSWTALQVAQRLLQSEGPRAFLHGATARILTLAPGTAISWVIYDISRSVLGS